MVYLFSEAERDLLIDLLEQEEAILASMGEAAEEDPDLSLEELLVLAGERYDRGQLLTRIRKELG